MAVAMVVLNRMLPHSEKAVYEEFVGLVLPHLLARAKTVEEHRRAFLALAVEAYTDAFRRIYAGVLESRPRDHFNDPDFAALGFWMNPNAEVADDPLFLAMRAMVVESLVERVSRLPWKARAAVVAEVERLTASGRKDNRAEWSAFLKRIQRRGSRLLGRLFRW